MGEIVLQRPPFVPSRRQLECLAARAAGGSRKDAAAILGISPRTVAFHLRALLNGARLHDDAQAIFFYRDAIAELVKHPEPVSIFSRTGTE